MKNWSRSIGMNCSLIPGTIFNGSDLNRQLGIHRSLSSRPVSEYDRAVARVYYAYTSTGLQSSGWLPSMLSRARCC